MPTAYAVSHDHWASPHSEPAGVLGWGDTDYYMLSTGGRVTPTLVFSGPGSATGVVWACRGMYPYWDRVAAQWACGPGVPAATEAPLPPGVWGIAVTSGRTDEERFHGNAVDYIVRLPSAP